MNINPSAHWDGSSSLLRPFRTDKPRNERNPRAIPWLILKVIGMRNTQKMGGKNSARSWDGTLRRDWSMSTPTTIRTIAVASGGILNMSGLIQREIRKHKPVIMDASPVFAPASMPAQDSI